MLITAAASQKAAYIVRGFDGLISGFFVIDPVDGIIGISQNLQRILNVLHFAAAKPKTQDDAAGCKKESGADSKEQKEGGVHIVRKEALYGHGNHGYPAVFHDMVINAAVFPLQIPDGGRVALKAPVLYAGQQIFCVLSHIRVFDVQAAA